MTRHSLVLVTCLLLAVACQAEQAPRDAQVFAEDALSVVPPAGWQVKHQKDTLVFVGGSPDDDARPVIAVRSVPVSGWGEPRTTENVAPSVKTVLEALPGAEVKGPTQIDHPAYRALAFDVVCRASRNGSLSRA